MIRSLRAWHRRWFLLLALLLPVLLYLSLVDRPRVPPVDRLPETNTEATTAIAGEAG